MVVDDEICSNCARLLKEYNIWEGSVKSKLSEEEKKGALRKYRRFALKYHPDKTSEQERHTTFKNVSSCVDNIVKDDNRASHYSNELDLEELFR